MDSLEAFINTQMNKEATLPILVSLAMAHYQFETIHPFQDGNGRLGRLLMPLILLERGLLREPLLHISPTLERRREEYVDLMLQVSQMGSWREWIMFFLEIVEASANEALGKARALRQLRCEYDTKVITRRVSALLPKLLDELFKRPSITIGRAVTVLGVTQPQAAAHIHKLETLGILTEVTGKAKNKRYAAMEILKIIFD
jgi:Fic family protein